MLNKLYINVPFTKVLSQMPSYEIFLKEILSNKRKIEEDETINLTKECSAIIQNKLPPKLKDPGVFSIPCVIGSETIEKAMCDLRVSVSLMSLSLCERLGIGQRNLLIVKLMMLKERCMGGNPQVNVIFCLWFMFCRIIKEGHIKESTNSTYNRCSHLCNIKSCELSFFLSPSFTLFYLLNH